MAIGLVVVLQVLSIAAGWYIAPGMAATYTDKKDHDSDKVNDKIQLLKDFDSPTAIMEKADINSEADIGAADLAYKTRFKEMVTSTESPGKEEEGRVMDRDYGAIDFSIQQENKEKRSEVRDINECPPLEPLYNSDKLMAMLLKRKWRHCTVMLRYYDVTEEKGKGMDPNDLIHLEMMLPREMVREVVDKARQLGRDAATEGFATLSNLYRFVAAMAGLAVVGAIKYALPHGWR